MSNKTKFVLFTKRKEKKRKENQLFWGRHVTYLALARDGLVKQQAAAVLVFQAGILRACGTGAHAPYAGNLERFEAVGGERRGRSGRVGLVAGGRPAPVTSRWTVAGRSERSCRTIVLPWTTETLWGETEMKGGQNRFRFKFDPKALIQMRFHSDIQLYIYVCVCVNHS